MSFSIKNIFQKGESPEQGGTAMMSPQPSPFGQPNMASPFAPMSQAEGGGFGNSLFRTVGGGEDMDGSPLTPPKGGSPFSPFGAASNSIITVGDILPQLPPELARANGAMPDQPVTISPQALETAISSGQLAVPVFEIYRVCPALFQAPVSPHDPRLVPLPKSKLPGMIAAHTGALTPPSHHQPLGGPPPLPNSPSSPLITAMPQLSPMQSPTSPFAPALPDLPQHPSHEAPRSGPMAPGAVRPAGTLPPRRPQGMPPAIPTQADFAGAPGPLSLPGHNQPPADPYRPSSRPLMAPPAAEQPHYQPPSASPFGQMPGAGMPSQTSLLFGSQPQSADPELESEPQASHPAQSPFGALPSFGPPPQPQGQAPSPFAAFAPAQPQSPASPFSAPAVASFEVPQRHVESDPNRMGNLPFSAQTHQQPAMPSPRPMGGVSPSMGADSHTMEVSLAAMLKGQSAQDLGFDASFIPGWITTKLPAADIRDQLHTGQVVLDLGTIIDGTDNTFKSVIAHGHRDYKVSVNTSEVFHSMPPAASHAAPAFTPAPAAAPTPFQQAAAPAFAMPSLPPTPTGPLLSVNPVAMPQRAPTGPLQPMSHAFSTPFGSPAHNPPPTPTSPLVPSALSPAPSPVQPAMGDFASPSMFMPAPTREGMGSHQLFGGGQPEGASPLFAPAPESRPPSGPLFAAGPVPQSAPIHKPHSFAPAAPEPAAPQNSFFAEEPSFKPAPMPEPGFDLDASRTPSKPLSMMADMAKVFGPQPKKEPEFQPAPVSSPQPRAVAPAAAPSDNSFGMSSTGSDEQLILRAMLGVSDQLDVNRVVELTARLPGVAACAFVRDARIVAHGDSSEPSQNFRQQAAEIAKSMRTLAEVTGLDAETLSIPTNDRLITFCFQGGGAFGVLHTDKSIPAGLREKITLLSRDVAQMSA